jgi:uncharacterized membrane protein
MTPSARRWPETVLLLLALIVILAFLATPPVGPLDKADHAAFAVCHRIAERSFIFGDRPLPLCARCSGTYLGATGVLAALLMLGRGRTGRFPARRWWPVLGAFFVAWAFDGANSLMTLLPGLPHLYEPANLLRLLTGTLQGLVLAVILLPALNLALWRAPATFSPIESWRDLAILVTAAGTLALPVATEWTPLLWPLALLSGLAILLLLGAINTMLALVLLRREGQAAGLREIPAPLLMGLALACIELLAIAGFRTWLTARFDLPL